MMENSGDQLTVERITRAAPRAARAPNHTARLVVDPADHQLQSPFLLLAEDWFAPPAGFPTHPHRGIETVTIALEGQLEHKDHTGAHGSLAAGDVQFMTAGSGILHSEMPGPQGVHSLQLWLNLPAAKKMTPPQYQDVPRGTAAHIPFNGGQMWLYTGEVAGETRPFASRWPLTLVDISLDANAETSVDLPARTRCFAYVLEGAIEAGQSRSRVAKAEVAWLQGSRSEEPRLFLKSGPESPARAIVFAAEPIDEPVVFGGPFVMNTQEEIDQAFRDLHAGRLVDG